MQKKALLALMLAMTLLLSGCALIVKDAEVDAKTPILTAGDTVVTKAEVQEAVNSQLYQMAYLYSMYGYSYDTTDPDNIASAQESAIQALKEDLVIKRKIEELGIRLDEEEETKAMESAQSDYDSDVEYAKTTLLADSGLEGDELTEAAKAKVEESGVTLETYQEEERMSALKSKLREEVIKDVTVSEEELKEEFDKRVADDQEKYDEHPGTYASAVNNGTTVYFSPSGVRRVKQILTKFHDEDQTKIDEATSKVSEANGAVTEATSKVSDAQAILDSEEATEEEKTQAQTDLEAAEAEVTAANEALTAAEAELDAAREAAFAALDEEVDAILADLAGGADWDTVMAEKNQDPGMQSGTAAEKGYAVAADMTDFDPAFVEAAMALEKIGDYSGKVKGNAYGYYIIRYLADEPVGEVDLETVRDTITSSLLSTNQSNKYNETLAQWVEDAGFKVDLNALKD